MAGHTNPCNPTGRRNRWRRASTCETSPSTLQDNPFMKSFDTQIVLEHVLGMTVYSNSALTSDPRSGVVAYPAGCVLVLLDSVKNKQLGTLKAPRKSITAASFSLDGRFVLTGESGLQPAVRVWSMTSMTEVAVLRGHSFGIKSAVFSPRMREIIVVGDAQDMMISVWAWPGKVMNSLNKFSDEIYAMDVSANSHYFVTVGNKHVKFYYLDTKRAHNGPDPMCPIPLTCRYGMLDNLKENCFCDVVCGQGANCYVFVITTSGILCQINSNRFLERWVNVNLSRASSLSCDGQHVFVGGCQGAIRMFNAFNLEIILTLPRPHCLDLDISQVIPSDSEQTESPFNIDDHLPNTSPSEALETATAAPSQKASATTEHSECTDVDKDANGIQNKRHPGVVALTFDPRHQNLTVVYEDHSLYIWRRVNTRREDGSFHFQKRYSSMYHRGGVWDLTTYPMTSVTMPGQQTDSLVDVSGEQAVAGAFPPGALLSVSADGTLRVWDVNADICQESVLKRNSVSPQCLKIVYGERQEPANHRKPQDTLVRRNPKPPDCLPGVAVSRHKKQGFTVVSVCPAGLHIATGNRHGRVSIYDTNSMQVTTIMHAHEAEVTALAYSITQNYKVLASGSRDRMIHLMDASRGYQLLTTLDDHSSTITAINFTYISHYLIMATSSLDMSVLVRVYMGSEAFILNPVRAIVEKKSITDFAIHPWSGSLAFACQDRLVRVYSIMTSTDHHSFRGCPSYGGQLVKVQFDPSGQYLLTACSLKTINLLQYTTGTLLSTFSGHAESITSIRFSHNVKHVISAAVDGCIFLWRLPQSVTYAVKKEMAEMGRLTRAMVFKKSWKKSSMDTNKLPKPTASEPALSSTSDRRLEQRPPYPPSAAAAHTLHETIDSTQGCYLDDGQARQEIQHRQQETANFRHQIGDPNAAIWNQGIPETAVVPMKTPGTLSRSKSSDWDEEYPDWESQNGGDFQPSTSRQGGFMRQGFNPLYPNHVCSTRGDNEFDFEQTSVKPNAWLTACCERRRIFKLEARSIKKILGMMRLVTDAMEKDLANTDHVMSSSPRPPPCIIQHQQNSSCRSVPAYQPAGSYTKTTSNANNAHNYLASHSLQNLNENTPNSGIEGGGNFFFTADVEAKHFQSCSPREESEAARRHGFYTGFVHPEPDAEQDMRSTHTSLQFEKLLTKPHERGHYNAETWSSAVESHNVCNDICPEQLRIVGNTGRVGKVDAIRSRQLSEYDTSLQLVQRNTGFTNSLFCMSYPETSDSEQSLAEIKDLNFTTSNGYWFPNRVKDRGKWFEELRNINISALLPQPKSIINRPGFLLLSAEPIVLNAFQRLQALMGQSLVKTIRLNGSAGLVLENNTSKMAKTTLSLTYPGEIPDDNQVNTDTEENLIDACNTTAGNVCEISRHEVKKARYRLDRIDSDTDSDEDFNGFDTRPVRKDLLRKSLEKSEEHIIGCLDHFVTRKTSCKDYRTTGVSSLVADYPPFCTITHEYCQNQTQTITSTVLHYAKRCKSDTELITSNGKSRKITHCVNSCSWVFTSGTHQQAAVSSGLLTGEMVNENRRDRACGKKDITTEFQVDEEKTGEYETQSRIHDKILMRSFERELKTNEIDNKENCKSLDNNFKSIVMKSAVVDNLAET